MDLGSRLHVQFCPDLTMVEMGRLRPSVLVTFPVAGIKYPDQNLQEGRVSSASQYEGAAHMSRESMAAGA